MPRSQRLSALWDRRARGWASPRSEAKYFGPNRRWICARAVGATLEVGCGTGANFAYLGPDITLTALDFAPKMVQTSRAAAATLGRQVHLQVANAQALPFADGQFDCVISTWTLCCVEDEVKAVSEMARVLKPGGRLLLVDHIKSSNRLIGLAQRLVEIVSVPLSGEHYTRRPLKTATDLGLEVVASERSHLGITERLQATKK